MVKTPEQIAAIFFYCTFAIQFVVYGVIFFTLMWKQVQPVRARSKVLLIAQYLGTYGFITTGLTGVLDDYGCPASFATGWILSFVLLATVFVRVVRLLLIYNLNRQRFLENADPTWYTNPRIVSEFSIFLMFFAVMGFFIIYRIFTFVFEIVHNHQPASNACGSPTAEVGTVGVALVIIGFIIIGWKLRKAHDAFFIKREFLLLLLLAVFVLPSYMMAVADSLLVRHIGSWGILLVGNGLVVVSYGIPAYLGIKTLREISNTASYESTTARDSEQPDVKPNFVGFSKAREWIADPICIKYIEKYIVHYQDVESGDNILLWFQLKEFSKLPDEFLTAKASLLYQKFIKPGAYRYVKFISREQREQIGKILEEAMKEDGATVPRNIFDRIMEEVETLLIQRVFKGFKSSEFYVEYREAVMLSSNL